MPACSSIYRLRAFFACFPAPCGFLFLSFSYSFRGGSHALPLFRFPSGAVFIVFPCPFLIAFSPFSLPFDAAFPRFICFPFVSRIAVACRGAMRCRFPPVPVSSPVSVFDAVGRGGDTCSVVWGIAPWRGVAGMAGCLAAFCLTARFYGMRDEAFWLVFSCGNYREGLLVGWTGRRGWFICGGTSIASEETPRGFVFPRGVCLVLIVLYVVCRRLIFSCVVRWCGWRWRRRRVWLLRLLPALRRFGRVAGYRPGREREC